MNWFWLLAALAILVFWAFSHHRRNQRRRLLRAWARRRGLSFKAGPDNKVGIRFLELQLLGGGGPTQGRNLASGTIDGREVHAFDVVRGDGEDDEPSHRHSSFSCVLVKADLPLIPLQIRPEGMGDRLAGALGFDDINFESAAFSAQFHVTSADRKWAYDVVNGQQMEYLLSRPRVWLELGGWYCLVARSGSMSPEDYNSALETARGFLDGIPESVKIEILGPRS